jgi:hypothetical protein
MKVLGLLLYASSVRAAVPQAACLEHPFLSGTVNIVAAPGTSCTNLVRAARARAHPIFLCMQTEASGRFLVMS